MDFFHGFGAGIQDLGSMQLQLLEVYAGSENKNTTVPKVIPIFNQLLCGVSVRFLKKTRYFETTLMLDFGTFLNIAIAGFG